MLYYILPIFILSEKKALSVSSSPTATLNSTLTRIAKLSLVLMTSFIALLPNILGAEDYDLRRKIREINHKYAIIVVKMMN